MKKQLAYASSFVLSAVIIFGALKLFGVDF